MAKEVSYSDFFDKLVHRVPGVQAAFVSDREGVVLIKSLTPEFDEQSIEPSHAALFAVATEQASKLGLGKNKSIIHMYKEQVIVHVAQLPLVISFIAHSNANIGALIALAPQLTHALAPLAQSVAAALDRENEL